jgi:hypothetical protein
MRSKIMLLCALFAFSLSSIAQDIKIGDVIQINGEVGVVFAISKDGMHGRLLSLEESGGLTWNSAEEWCSELGEGWRLPTLRELKMINGLLDNQDFIDGLFFADADEIIEDGVYWSSNLTEYITYYDIEFEASCLQMGIGEVFEVDTRAGMLTARAVLAF